MRIPKELLDLDLYALFDLDSSATPAEVRRAYRYKARQSHPDLNPEDESAEQRLALLNRAAHILLDPGLNRSYLRTRARTIHREPDWFERCNPAHEPGEDLDWGSPASRAPAHRKRPSAAGRAGFSRRVRDWNARCAALVGGWVPFENPSHALVLTALCLVLGSGLIACARPSNAFWSASFWSAHELHLP
ncbi:MAG TPA: DnaJ domain-containing protein [Polyangiaceae bacterium]|nr:DnaJ domain-containing protein [Polyangiaceae bacterium]